MVLDSASAATSPEAMPASVIVAASTKIIRTTTRAAAVGMPQSR